MKTKYRGCIIEVVREKSMSGDSMLFYSVFDEGYEVTSGFSESEDSVKDFANDLKHLVDDYREHPEEYGDMPEDSF